jgi:hypothetical protein
MNRPMNDDFFFTSDYDELLHPFWPDLFSSNRKRGPSHPTWMPYTSVTQHHISNQMFPLPYVSGLGQRADELMADAPAKRGDQDADMMDADIVEDFFDFGKYGDEGREANDSQEPSLHPRDSISNHPTPRVAAEASPSLSIVPCSSKKVLQPFEQLKQSQGPERCAAQQKKRTKKWLDGIANEYLPMDRHC